MDDQIVTQQTQSEKVVVKTTLGDFTIEQSHIQSLVLDTDTKEADKLAKAAMQEAGLDLVGLVVNILTLAGVSKERLELFTTYPLIEAVRNKTALPQILAINSYFHHEFGILGIKGYYARSALNTYSDVKTWVRVFADIVSAQIVKYDLPALPGQEVFGKDEEEGLVKEAITDDQPEEAAEQAVGLPVADNQDQDFLKRWTSPV